MAGAADERVGQLRAAAHPVRLSCQPSTRSRQGASIGAFLVQPLSGLESQLFQKLVHVGHPVTAHGPTELDPRDDPAYGFSAVEGVRNLLQQVVNLAGVVAPYLFMELVPSNLVSSHRLRVGKTPRGQGHQNVSASGYLGGLRAGAGFGALRLVPPEGRGHLDGVEP